MLKLLAFLAVVTALGAVVVGCVRALSLENKLIFFPSDLWTPPVLPVQDAVIHTADGVQLHGWYLPRPEPRAVVLFAHGNAGNLSQRQPTLGMLHDLGCSVLIFDYRGYGKSEGSPDEAGVYLDARAARDWLVAREAIEPGDVVLYGRSLGAAVVADLAAADGARGLILESAFASLGDVAREHYPGWMVGLLLTADFDTLSKIDGYRGPLLMIHGEADEIVPFRSGRALFDAAHEPKRFVPIPGAGHNSPQSSAAVAAIDTFLGELTP